jgi:hypothetical protein
VRALKHSKAMQYHAAAGPPVLSGGVPRKPCYNERRYVSQRPKPEGKGLHFQVSWRLLKQRPDGRPQAATTEHPWMRVPSGCSTQISTARQGFTRQRNVLVSTSYLELFRCEAVGSRVPRECLTHDQDTRSLCQVRSQHWAKAGYPLTRRVPKQGASSQAFRLGMKRP